MSRPPRSARELLTGYGLSEGVITGILDIHAHELAEQQRAGLGDVLERWAGYLHQDTISEVIDLIDPQKSAVPVHPDE